MDDITPQEVRECPACKGMTVMVKCTWEGFLYYYEGDQCLDCEYRYARKTTPKQTKTVESGGSLAWNTDV